MIIGHFWFSLSLPICFLWSERLGSITSLFQFFLRMHLQNWAIIGHENQFWSKSQFMNFEIRIKNFIRDSSPHAHRTSASLWRSCLKIDMWLTPYKQGWEQTTLTKLFNPFHTTGLFLYPLVFYTLWFSDVFGGYKKSGGMKWGNNCDLICRNF